MKPADLTRTTFAVLFIGLLIAASLWILRPFLGAAIWATTVVVATWPVMKHVQRRLWNRRAPAVMVMTVGLLLLFVVPLAFAIVTIVDNADRIADWARLLTTLHVPDAPPQWLVELPFVGAKVAEAWARAAAAGIEGLLAQLTPYAGNLTKWFVGEVGGVGYLLFQFVLTAVIAAILWSHGEEAGALVRRFAVRLAGERGEQTVALAGSAIRGVALGVGVTALAQALLAGIGLALAGLPFAALLTALVFMLCIAQIGPLPVMLPAAGWLFWSGSTGWGIFVSVVTIVVVTMDNVLRPLLIRMGADLPLLLIFAGVIGGLLAFGLVGIFVGPVVLAVAYTLLESWMAERG